MADFGEGIYEFGKKIKRSLAHSRSCGSLKLLPFIKDFPERYLHCRIAEANMMGIAARLTIGGKIPYPTTFANFSTGCVYGQISQSIANSNQQSPSKKLG